jgi:hypothetical protein
MSYPGYTELYQKLRGALGHIDNNRANPMIAREQLVCWKNHDKPFPPGILRYIDNIDEFSRAYII